MPGTKVRVVEEGGPPDAVVETGEVGEIIINGSDAAAVTYNTVNWVYGGELWEIDLDLPLMPVVLPGKVLDVALFLEDLRETALELGPWHFHLAVAGLKRVADAGQHVGNGVGHRHWNITSIYARNGMPRCDRRARPSSSVLALV